MEERKRAKKREKDVKNNGIKEGEKGRWMMEGKDKKKIEEGKGRG